MNFSWPHDHRNEIVSAVNFFSKWRILALKLYLYLARVDFAIYTHQEILALKFIRAERKKFMHCRISVIIATLSPKVWLLLALNLCLSVMFIICTNHEILVLEFIIAERGMFSYYGSSAVISWALLQTKCWEQMPNADFYSFYLL